MPSTPSLIQKLKIDFPDLNFVPGDNFHWSAPSRTVTYNETHADANAHLLHELSHAILEHARYERDVELIGLERDAWAHAKTTLGPHYHQSVSAQVITDSLDSYRDWLHARSTCPHCHASGLETKKAHYHCIACGEDWTVNEARICGLKRYKI